jgi:hypothetical protein
MYNVLKLHTTYFIGQNICCNGAEQETSSQECEKNKSQVYSKNLHAKVIFYFLHAKVFASVYPLFSGFIQSLWLQTVHHIVT